MIREMVLTNGDVVLADEVLRGTVVVRDGRIAEIDDAPSHLRSAEDLEGDMLIPGLVELHTDNIERHLLPRPKAPWPPEAAVIAHDREVAAAGITTVCNAIAVGAVTKREVREAMLTEIYAAVDALGRSGALKASHLLHYRCEIGHPGLLQLLEPAIGHPTLRVISVMDHTPGQRQFADLDRYATFYKGHYGMNDAELETFLKDRQDDQVRYAADNRAAVVKLAADRGIALASHDDATVAHVEEAIADGMVIAEFPTTVEAADASHRNGLAVLMGGPNMVRGESHSGNVSARELAERGTLDIISSDYIPASSLYAALVMEESVDAIALPEAIAAVTRNPARQIGLDDRGEIAAGRRADLVRVRRTGTVPAIRTVWREGEVIA